jgi:hypothetical protein
MSNSEQTPNMSCGLCAAWATQLSLEVQKWTQTPSSTSAVPHQGGTDKQRPQKRAKVVLLEPCSTVHARDVSKPQAGAHDVHVKNGSALQLNG